jgi:hypothetical protein
VTAGDVTAGDVTAGDVAAGDFLLLLLHTRHRLGWTGDSALTSEEALSQFDLGAFYHNWAKMIDEYAAISVSALVQCCT